MIMVKIEIPITALKDPKKVINSINFVCLTEINDWIQSKIVKSNLYNSLSISSSANLQKIKQNTIKMDTA